MRCGLRPRRAAAPGRARGSGPPRRSRSSSSGSPTRPGTRSRPPRPRRPRRFGRGRSTRGAPCSRTAAIAVRQLIPNSRATAATDAPSSPTRRQISARARPVSDARAAMHGEVSVHVLVGQSRCGHRHTRLIHTTVTGRPPAGRSRTHTGRRSCNSATAAQDGQPTRSAVVSIACSSSPSCSDTASTTKPAMPNITAAALRSRSTWGLRLVSLTPRIMRPQAHTQAQAEDRVLQRRTTLRDEEPLTPHNSARRQPNSSRPPTPSSSSTRARWVQTASRRACRTAAKNLTAAPGSSSVRMSRSSRRPSRRSGPPLVGLSDQDSLSTSLGKIAASVGAVGQAAKPIVWTVSGRACPSVPRRRYLPQPKSDRQMIVSGAGGW